MDIDDVGYMYHLIVWSGGLFILGAPVSWLEEAMLGAQEMEGGIVIFDAETYDEAFDMQEYLKNPDGHVGKLDREVYELVAEDYCGAMDITLMEEKDNE